MYLSVFFIGLLLALWSYSSYFAALIIFFVILALLQKKIRLNAIIFFLVLGYFWGELNIFIATDLQYPKNMEGKTISIEGRIASVPASFKENTQFQFYVNHLENSDFHGKITLSWFKNRMTPTIPHLIPGEKWHLTVKLKKPRSFSNPGSFDYEAWLFEQRILAKGYIVQKGKNQLLAPAKWHYWIEQVRQKLFQQWMPFLAQWPLLGVLLALTIGLTSHITPEQWQVFTNTGTIHLISISGFHISMMAGMGYALMNFIWRRITFLCERFPSQKAGAIAAIIIGLFYSLLAGSSIPTERSIIMLMVFMSSLVIQRHTNVWQCFSWSLWGVILLDPFAPLNMSFWLSFGAVGMILYAMLMPTKRHCEERSDAAIHSYIQKIMPSTKQWLSLQIKIFLGLVPFSLFWFSQVSVTSLWANLVAIPVTGFFVLPLALVSIILSKIYFPWAFFLMKLAHWFFSQLFCYLNWITHEHSIILFYSFDKIGMLILGVLGTLLLLAPGSFPARWLGLIFWLPLLFPIKPVIPYGEAYINLLDVGQGLASVIQTKNHVLVFDTGPKISDSFDTGKAVVLPYLRNQHISSVDTLVISHADMDHRGGLNSVLQGIAVKKIYVNDLHILSSAYLCKANVFWEWDGVKFQFLTKGLENFNNTNDRSCVLKISNQYHSALFPGDLEAKGEKKLLSEYESQLKSDLIIAGHHGSKTSSSLAWLTIVNPSYVLYPTGYLNRYHFPNTEIVQRYHRIHAQGFSTADCGMIHWKLRNNSDTDKPECYRQKHWHPWY